MAYWGQVTWSVTLSLVSLRTSESSSAISEPNLGKPKIVKPWYLGSWAIYLGNNAEDNGVTFPRSYQLPRAPQSGVKSWPLPSLCWSVDWLDIVQFSCLILSAKVLLYPEEIISQQYSLTCGFYISMIPNWSMWRGKVTTGCSGIDGAFMPHLLQRPSQKKGCKFAFILCQFISSNVISSRFLMLERLDFPFKRMTNIPTKSGRGFPFLHILVNTYYFSSYW